MAAVMEMLEELQHRAHQDPKLRQEFLDTKCAADPVGEFCRKCRELGYEIYEMELISAGEEFYAEIKRSTNGGGENSPLLEGQNDAYELFFAALEKGDW